MDLNDRARRAAQDRRDEAAEIEATKRVEEVQKELEFQRRRSAHLNVSIPVAVEAWCKFMGVEFAGLAYEVTETEHEDGGFIGGSVNDRSHTSSSWRSQVKWRLQDHDFRAVITDYVTDGHNARFDRAGLQEFFASRDAEYSARLRPAALGSVRVAVGVVPSDGSGEVVWKWVDSLEELGEALLCESD